MHLLSLVGEQPIPNLLVARGLEATKNILCYTETTQRVAGNLKSLLPGAKISPVTPYPIDKAIVEINHLINQDTTVNLTGGTKPMALAAYEVARKHHLRMVYLQSEGSRSILYDYTWDNDQIHLVGQTDLGPLINIDDYLLAHGLRPYSEKGPQNAQEAGLKRWFEKHVDECRNNLIFEGLEIDFLLRRGNQVAILEAKMKGKNSREGIDQLNTAGGKTYLGSYTKKILIVSRPLGSQLRHLAEARQIDVIVVNGEVDHRTGRLILDQPSRDNLARAIDRNLGRHA